MIVSLSLFQSAIYLTQNGPNLPQNHPKRFHFCSNILYVVYTIYFSIGRSLIGRFWAEFA